MDKKSKVLEITWKFFRHFLKVDSLTVTKSVNCGVIITHSVLSVQEHQIPFQDAILIVNPLFVFLMPP